MNERRADELSDENPRSQLSTPVRFDPSGPYETEEYDLPFAHPGGLELLARIYRPKGLAQERLPALVDAHGGAWCKFDRRLGAICSRGLAACGLVVASVDFRQAPDYQHPLGSADVAAGVRFVRANAAKLDVDPDRIGLMGGSSGGHLALLAAIKPNAPEHRVTPIVVEGPGDGRDVDASVSCVLALWPVSDPLARYQWAVSQRHVPPEDPPGFNPLGLIEGHLGYFGSEAVMEAASVHHCLARGEAQSLPPVWVAQPEVDQNVPSKITEALVAAYRKAGGEIECRVFPGTTHAFGYFPGPDTDWCIEAMRAFVAQHLRPR
jgi:acetyl esterase